MKKCFVVGQLDENLKIVSVFRSSEAPPMNMSQDMSKDHVVICESSAETFQEAYDSAKEIYDRYATRIAAAFPLSTST